MKHNECRSLRANFSHRVFCTVAVFALFFSSCESPLRTEIMTLTEAFASIKEEKAIYVDDALGTDSNPGTQDLPKKTIQAGIDFVVSFLVTGTVKVKNGTYLQTEKLLIKEGASIEGGYDENWVQQENQDTVVQGRDAASGDDNIVTAETVPGVTSATVISYISFQTGLGISSMTVAIKNASPVFKYCNISGSGGMNMTTAIAVMTLSGFTQRSEPLFRGCLIEGGNVGDIGTIPSSDTYAVSAAGDATVTFEYCILAPGSSSSGKSYGINFALCEINVSYCQIVGDWASAFESYAMGIYGKNGTLNLKNSHIMGGSVGLNTMGIYVDNCGGYIRNSTVYGGKGFSSSVGILLAGSQIPYVRNCTVNGGGSIIGKAYGILGYSKDAVLENCLLWTDKLTSSSWAVAMISSGTEIFPAKLNNCVFFNAQYSYGYSFDTQSVLSYTMSSGGIAGMQSYLNATAQRSSANLYISSVSGVGIQNLFQAAARRYGCLVHRGVPIPIGGGTFPVAIA